MTEKEWLDDNDSEPACTKVQIMIDFVESKTSGRKLRLYAVACCRRVLPLIENDQCRNGVKIGELFADGLADDAIRIAAETGFWESFPREGRERLPPVTLAVIEAACGCLDSDGYHAATAGGSASAAVGWATLGNIQDPIVEMQNRWNESSTAARKNEVRNQLALLRDIFGNPFRPVVLDPRWLSSTVLDLARTIYDERRAESMPILADALMDASCDSEEILAHCRDGGPHVRGCWVVDLLLGRS